MTKKRLTLLTLLIVGVAALATCGKNATSKRQREWHGLTESEARAKLDDKLPGKIPADKREAITDKVVAKMRDRGVITDDAAAPDDPSGLTADELATN